MYPAVRRDSANGESDLTRAVFHIDANVATFRRLVDNLGTPEDTPQHRERLHQARLHIGELVKDASEKFIQASEADWQTRVSATKKSEDVKHAKDFEAVLKISRKLSRLRRKERLLMLHLFLRTFFRPAIQQLN